MLHPTLQKVTTRIRRRSQPTRLAYIEKVSHAKRHGASRHHLSCGNIAHSYAGCSRHEKSLLALERDANFAIISAYNEILSAHQPYVKYPQLIKEALQELPAVAQFAAGVPAMCDGVTQGQDGMELSLFSRDVIAMSTAIALSHNIFDGIICLGICDKIVPGLLIGALAFGHLPAVFIPAGPMPSGLANAEKVKVRQLYAEGKVDRAALLLVEKQSYHSAGTCTFYGTANSNQMLMEIMGLQLPSSSFVHPGTALRDQLTQASVRQLVNLTAMQNSYTPLADIIDEKTLVNGIVGLLATGGSSNHTIHLIAIAKAAGIIIDWQDMADLSAVVPLLCRIYPNGEADINHFHAAGGMGLLIHELLQAGLLHGDVKTILAEGGLLAYCQEAFIQNDKLTWRPARKTTLDDAIIRPVKNPFSEHGGLTLLSGNLGRSVIKVSAVKPEHRRIEAAALIFHHQDELQQRFDDGQLNQDFIAVLRFQGPKANGMPELHKLTPVLGVLQDRGFKVALITDGRMSGASGKIPAAIHLSPEALDAGPIAKLKDGDKIILDANAGRLNVMDEAVLLRAAVESNNSNTQGVGRELFAGMRAQVSSAEEGASFFL
ncbi:MAG: phosphogluconate dehydratase [Pseudomonadales bacterium]|nr:phosphogluconate dehydratase [Pseudomonadales bacterium]